MRGAGEGFQEARAVRALGELVAQLRGERKRARIIELPLNRFQRHQPND